MKYFFAFLLFFQTFIYAQENKKDSILKLIGSTDSANEKASLYLKLANEYKKTQVDSAIYFAEKGYRVAKQADDKIGVGENAGVLGDLYVAKNKFEKARFYFTIAVNYWKGTDKQFNYCQGMMVLGNINIIDSKYVEAFKLYNAALEISEKRNYKELIPHLNNNIGSVYDEIGDYKESEKYYKKAYDGFIKLGNKYQAIVPLVNISNIQLKSGRNKEAIENFNHILQMIGKTKVWEDFIFAYKSIASTYIVLKEYDKAEVYNDKALKIINENKVSSSGYRGPISLDILLVYHNAATVYNEKNQLDKALEYAHKGLKPSMANSYKKLIYSNASLLFEIFEKKKQVDSALYYSKLYMRNYKEFNEENDAKKVAQLALKVQFENAARDKEIANVKNQAKSKRNELIYLGTSIFTILAVIIMILLFRNQKTKLDKLVLMKENLELEKVTLSHDLEYKRKELASNMMNLVSKNEFILSIAQKLKVLKAESNDEVQKDIQQLIVELNQNTSSKIWEEFEIRFKEVHSAFYENLNRLYPDLTPNEIKICAFLRLNMSTKDIAAVTHQSVKSINMARFRLRKKLNIESDENLIGFLIQL